MPDETNGRHEVIVYSTTYCGHCVRLKRQLEEAGIEYRSIDVDEEEHYGERIIQATGGARVVPTVEIADRLLVNPSIREVVEALARSK